MGKSLRTISHTARPRNNPLLVLMSADLPHSQSPISSANSKNPDKPTGDASRLIHDFPTELFQIIFGHVVTPPFAHWSESAPALDSDVRRAPFNLAAVCARWRDTALQTPEIWSCIHVTNPAVRDPIAYVDVCVDRSGQWPLDVILNLSNGEILQENDSLQIWAKLCSQGSRWRRCHFVLGSKEVCWAYWPSKATMLEELVAHTQLEYYFSADDHDELRNRLLPIAPDLKRLSFNSLHRTPTAYGSLEYLSICLRQSSDPSKLWEVLSQTPLLHQVRIFWPFEIQREEGPPQQTIVLPRLQRLEIYGHTALNFDAYVSTLELPALHTVVVSTYTCYKLAAFFQRFASQVHTLVVRYEGYSHLAQADAGAISQLRCLETLVISGRCIDNANLGDDLVATSAVLSFLWFFDTLREASNMTELRKIQMLNCISRWQPAANVAHLMGNSFEITFTGCGKGWDDPRIALFMASEPTSVADDVPSIVTVDA